MPLTRPRKSRTSRALLVMTAGSGLIATIVLALVTWFCRPFRVRLRELRIPASRYLTFRKLIPSQVSILLTRARTRSIFLIVKLTNLPLLLLSPVLQCTLSNRMKPVIRPRGLRKLREVMQVNPPSLVPECLKLAVSRVSLLVRCSITPITVPCSLRVVPILIFR